MLFRSPGDRLPSTRALATDLGLSRTVCAAAYDQLLAEGWLAGRAGSGTYVVGVPAASPSGSPTASTTPPTTGPAASTPAVPTAAVEALAARANGAEAQQKPGTSSFLGSLGDLLGMAKTAKDFFGPN